MSAPLCTVCGAVLRNGACPNGHPQRSSRRRERRSRRGLWAFLFVFLVLAAAAYGGLVLYPRTAASDVIGPASEDFSESLVAYRATAGAFPPGETDAQVVASIADAVVAAAAEARIRLTDASVRLERREVVDVPIVSSRPPLDEAAAIRDRLAQFYSSALEVVADLEGISGYLSQVAGLLPQLDGLQNTLNAARAPNPGPAVTSAVPVADQLIADLQALTPPDEIGGLHSSLIGIAERVRQGLDDVTAAAQGDNKDTIPVVQATLQALRDELTTFRSTLGSATQLARRAGLSAMLQEVDALAVEITERLAALRDQGVEGISLPGEE